MIEILDSNTLQIDGNIHTFEATTVTVQNERYSASIVNGRVEEDSKSYDSQFTVSVEIDPPVSKEKQKEVVDLLNEC